MNAQPILQVSPKQPPELPAKSQREKARPKPSGVAILSGLGHGGTDSALLLCIEGGDGWQPSAFMVSEASVRSGRVRCPFCHKLHETVSLLDAVERGLVDVDRESDGGCIVGLEVRDLFLPAAEAATERRSAMSETTSRHLIKWGNCDEEQHQSCEDCRIDEDASHRSAVLLEEWAEAINDLATRAREEDDPRLSLVAIQGLATVMQDLAIDVIDSTRPYRLRSSETEPEAPGPTLVPEEHGPTSR